jgi:lambda family phage holin
MATDQGPGQLAVEMASAIAAAAVAAYVRARGAPSAWTLPAIAARVAEAVVCGFLAISAASLMQWTDPRTTVGFSAGLGLLGTEAIRDLLMRLADKRVDRE